MTDFKDKIVLVTGAGRGIGREIATAFAIRSARVALNDLTPVNLDPTVATLQAKGGAVKGYLADVAKKIPVQTMIAQIVEEWERIDILINNAGVEPHAPLLDLDEWDWQRTLNVNLTGPFLTTQIVGRVMREQGGGMIVNIGSTASQAHGLNNRSAFIASKAGLVGLTRAAAHELAPYNIRVNAVCPGIIETEQNAPLRQEDANVVHWQEQIPQGKLGKPTDVAALVLFLCSPAAAYLTGQVINVDGGLAMN